VSLEEEKEGLLRRWGKNRFSSKKQNEGLPRAIKVAGGGTGRCTDLGAGEKKKEAWDEQSLAKGVILGQGTDGRVNWGLRHLGGSGLRVQYL